MSIEDRLFSAAVELVEKRYPKGWGGAAAMRVESGDILTSIAPETKLDALSVCMELGAYLEAHKREERVTHSLCVARETEAEDFRILSPCGICQERLRYWGTDVSVAVTNPANELIFRPLSDLQSYHWSLAYDQS